MKTTRAAILVSGLVFGAAACGPANTASNYTVGTTIEDGELEASDIWAPSGAAEQTGVDAYRATLEASIYTVRMCHRSGSTFDTHVQVYDSTGQPVTDLDDGGRATPDDPAGHLQTNLRFTPAAAGEYTFVCRFHSGTFTAAAFPGDNDYQFRVEAGDTTDVGCPIR